jgi:hypothetical protein
LPCAVFQYITGLLFLLHPEITPRNRNLLITCIQRKIVYQIRFTSYLKINTFTG